MIQCRLKPVRPETKDHSRSDAADVKTQSGARRAFDRP
jgi:hypothetical protein